MRENVTPLIKYDSHVGFEAKKFSFLQWYSDYHQEIYPDHLCLTDWPEKDLMVQIWPWSH